MLTPEVLNIISDGAQEVVRQELVLDGLESNHRALKITYTLGSRQVTEIRTYLFPADSEKWAAYTSTFDVKEVPNG